VRTRIGDARSKSFYSEKQTAAKALFTQQLYRSLGLSAHLEWARLLVGRYREFVQIPTE
jgi:hypothetical protein